MIHILVFNNIYYKYNKKKPVETTGLLTGYLLLKNLTQPERLILSLDYAV
ncbi:hypothetical protein FFL01_12210 [Flavobacterium flevense]|uniref:Uncharacterized protein n=1 Tax=Flavobacterium flevense TaxID=983 RepID=A0A4Y4AX27_9FLAO|nr:hypothetical protein FFL01_12210 [Flavobacterium flevense]